MAVASLRWKFLPECVRETPDQQGVFTLWDRNECVYIGHTTGNASLRDRLRDYLRLRKRGVIEATHFTWEATPTPRTREGDLLSICLHKHGRLPRYNGPGSPLGGATDCVSDLRARR